MAHMDIPVKHPYHQPRERFEHPPKNAFALGYRQYFANVMDVGFKVEGFLRRASRGALCPLFRVPEYR